MTIYSLKSYTPEGYPFFIHLRHMKSVTEIYLSLGSNLGNREELLTKAIELLTDSGHSPLDVSSLYKSAPWGYQSSNRFLNQVMRTRTHLVPEALLELFHSIEYQLGRTRTQSAGYMDRTIDIDLLFYGDRIIDTVSLQVPHPGIPARRFILEPMTELAPSFVHPILEKDMQTLLRECEDKNPVSVYTSTSAYDKNR